MGLQHAGEIIRVNFGHEPLKFDIASHVQRQRNAIWKTTLSDEQSNRVLDKLVLTYLVVRAFQKQAWQMSPIKPFSSPKGG
ncbi:uncharacterized protein LACBIDRAFT_308898 [Laccaria bicolor S238N-H82]|uniref:Predicted protein n=1 Tax=Laccaria bicolor (strain S238N-H82 / ATCC MYA-4686) TaxID=486041 RepID=B0CV11_LACBS|nr:uncharacterized protein LACBIDRAFT_308898 [Laccaria bicolor S238N-H82]EDR13248.1 predicted protein [Laccaria bicolor S238N-H82]|eukprot:XP_001875746.1 predicted protein [Laccaria bicolor S238N-H82]